MTQKEDLADMAILANNISRWNGMQWHDVAGGVDERVTTIEAYSGGEYMISGGFENIGAGNTHTTQMLVFGTEQHGTVWLQMICLT